MITTTKNKAVEKIFAAMNRFATIDYLGWVICDIKEKGWNIYLLLSDLLNELATLIFGSISSNSNKRINKQLLLLVMLIGYLNYYVNWLNEAIWKPALWKAIKDILLWEKSF